MDTRCISAGTSLDIVVWHPAGVLGAVLRPHCSAAPPAAALIGGTLAGPSLGDVVLYLHFTPLSLPSYALTLAELLH